MYEGIKPNLRCLVGTVERRSEWNFGASKKQEAPRWRPRVTKPLTKTYPLSMRWVRTTHLCKPTQTELVHRQSKFVRTFCYARLKKR